MAESLNISPTQRAYTLRLRGPNREDQTWRDALWATHDAVNKGAKSFGNWLLTLRGGIDHELAGKDPQRRTLLALSWLSVESDPKLGDPHEKFLVGDDKEQVVAALRQILTDRGVKGKELESWIKDCSPALTAEKRSDAKWINRSKAFDAARKQIGTSLTREEIWDILEPFFASKDAYLAPLAADDEEEDRSGSEEKAKDLVQKAGGWLSTRFGEGKGADFKKMVAVYKAIASWAENTRRPATMESLAEALRSFHPESNTAEGILGLISGPGYKSATRNLVGQWDKSSDVKKLRESALEDYEKCKANVGGKGRRPWSDAILEHVEAQCGFTYLQQDGPARHKEFSVMLDHAARRVSITHSWIKRAEAERRKFVTDAQRIGNVLPEVAAWLDQFCKTRSANTGADEGYRIRKRAIGGWKELVGKWSRTACKTAQDRIAVARELQSDPAIDKFGDIQLFEALATDDAQIVWRTSRKSDPQPLIDYVVATDAQAKRQRFKVPAYRHPDPLSHPVFCDFGNSRWAITFDIHERAKAAGKNKKVEETFDPRGIHMGLWDGKSLADDIPLRWSCKRLVGNLALTNNEKKDAVDVTRADRLGRAAANTTGDANVNIMGLFDQKDWNGRLQAPRRELDAIVRHLKNNGGTWDQKVEKMRRRLHWLVTFSAKLQPKGPWTPYAKDHGLSVDPKYWPHSEENKKRKGMGKLILSRLPGLRVLSVDLGHRYAAACAVLQTLSESDMVAACHGKGHADPRNPDLYIHLIRQTNKIQKNGRNKGKPVTETIVYRRIGPDKLPDGSEHPAPWARLDRQFLIKLQGEEQPARAAATGMLKDGSPTEINEIALVANMALELGLIKDDDEGAYGRGVDELMRQAVRIAKLGLRRHGRMAKIAYALNPKCPGIPLTGGGRDTESVEKRNEKYVEFVTRALSEWHALATDTDWDGTTARDLWNKNIKPLPGGFEVGKPAEPEPNAERPTRQQRHKEEDKFREKQIKPIAAHLANSKPSTTRAMFVAWTELWKNADGLKRTKDDFKHTLIRSVEGKVVASHTTPKMGKENAGGWHARLRLLTDWIAGRRVPGASSKAWSRKVGGLSLTRIATMRSLYQLHKAFMMRPTPEQVQGAPGIGESNAGIAQGILDAMEHMREQRVKQLASRIVEAALGIGSENREDHWQDGTKRPRARIDDPRFAPCHAVVIENLTNYRPEDKRTRRENRQLMTWSAAQVKKYLSEGCQLHGLHLREVSAAYTSRQDSRTGMPGIRCADVSANEFKARHWRSRVKQAMEKVQEARKRNDRADAESELLAAIEANKQNPSLLRLPLKSGDLFISADDGRTLQADLNAAANIGLRALMDPDWPGRWWYVPAEIGDDGWRTPAEKSCTGAACLKDFKVAQNSGDGTFSAGGKELTLSDDQDVKNAEEAAEAARKALDVAKAQLKSAKKQNQGVKDAEQAVEAETQAVKYAREPTPRGPHKTNSEEAETQAVKYAREALSATKKGANAKEILNLWSDCSSEELSDHQKERAFKTYDHYWNGVGQKIAVLLRKKNGLQG